MQEKRKKKLGLERRSRPRKAESEETRGSGGGRASKRGGGKNPTGGKGSLTLICKKKNVQNEKSGEKNRRPSEIPGSGKKEKEEEEEGEREKSG